MPADCGALLRLALLLLCNAAANIQSIAVPTPAQLAWQAFSPEHMPLRTFHHFDICTFTGCEHNSGTANRSAVRSALHSALHATISCYCNDVLRCALGWRWHCCCALLQGSGAPGDFAPTQAVNASQWVLAAKAMGAGSAVMTARHEGGFALWPSKYTNYSIAHSPYKGGAGDLVMEFVAACRRHGIKPGLYIAAGCDAYHHCGPEGTLTPSEYERRQNGMVQELVGGAYGHIEYLVYAAIMQLLLRR